MGMEDRDWYREKKIDWDNGGLKDAKAGKIRVRRHTWWILAAVIIIVAILLRQF